MEVIFYIIIFLFVLCPLTLFIIFKPYYDDKRIRKNVVNFDSTMKNYSFLLEMDSQTAIDMLAIQNVKDVPEFSFNKDTSTITFQHLNAKTEYQLTFITHDSHTYLKVERINFLCKNNIPYLINSFFISKLGATPIEYIQLESLITKY